VVLEAVLVSVVEEDTTLDHQELLSKATQAKDIRLRTHTVNETQAMVAILDGDLLLMVATPKLAINSKGMDNLKDTLKILPMIQTRCRLSNSTSSNSSNNLLSSSSNPSNQEVQLDNGKADLVIRLDV